MSEWQPIETAPKDGAFLVTDGAYIAEVWPLDEGGFRTTVNDYRFDDAKYWMPAPTLPTESDGEGAQK